MVVDDSLLARTMIRDHSRNLPGLDGSRAQNGEDTLAKTAEIDDIQLMTLDLNMLGIDGLELSVRL